MIAILTDAVSTKTDDRLIKRLAIRDTSMIHIRDEETDRIVRDLARHLDVSITQAVKIACMRALTSARDGESLWDRTADLRKKISQTPSTDEPTDKKFFDDLND